jgi:hypothetical protein
VALDRTLYEARNAKKGASEAKYYAQKTHVPEVSD